MVITIISVFSDSVWQAISPTTLKGINNENIKIFNETHKSHKEL